MAKTNNNIKAKAFSNRNMLEMHIARTYGSNAERNQTLEVVIEGTAQELQKLNLSTSNTVHGLRVVLK